jgi:hypothetical protein
MITRIKVIAAPSKDSFCGLVIGSMKYVIAKGHDGLIIG